MSQARTVLGVVVCAVLIALVAGCGKAEQPAAERNRPTFRATALTLGKSMLPTFGEAELVQLELCRFADLRTGDTVIYWHDGTRQYIHHRLSHRDDRDGRWITRGDNNPGQDTGRFTSDEFVGRTHKLSP